jgi:hypothetical protein
MEIPDYDTLAALFAIVLAWYAVARASLSENDGNSATRAGGRRHS